MMHVLLLEDNLLWSVRLANAVQALGHDATVVSQPDQAFGAADLAIVNLSSPSLACAAAIERLHDQGTVVVGHSGHKDTQRIVEGKSNGCDHIVTNGTLRHKLEFVLSLANTREITANSGL